MCLHVCVLYCNAQFRRFVSVIAGSTGVSIHTNKSQLLATVSYSCRTTTHVCHLGDLIAYMYLYAYTVHVHVVFHYQQLMKQSLIILGGPMCIYTIMISPHGTCTCMYM